MEAIIEPYVGVGPVRLGMSVQEVRQALGAEFKTFMKTPTSEMPSDFFRTLGFIVYYRSPGLCKAVELVKPATPIFMGRRLLGIRFSGVRSWFENIDDSLEIQDTGLTSYRFGIGLYVPSARKSPDDPVESAIVFEQGYYRH